MLNYAIIGFGGLGKSHFGNTKDLMSKVEGINLVALCDVNENTFKTQTAINLGSNNVGLDLSAYNIYNDAEELFEKEKLDFVITALPTYIHEKIAVMAMEKGIHVFSEKPMAINLEQAQNMLDKAKENNVKLMIGQCLRYWPEYVIAKDLIDNKKYGKVLYANFVRLSQTPKWSWQNWILDNDKGGGCALDMHVHDVDFINWAFGKPNSVTARATNGDCVHDGISAIYDYDDMYVTAISSWGLTDTYVFTADFMIRFEKATIELKNGKFMLYTDEKAEEIKFEPKNPYVEELVDFIDCIRTGREITINHPTSSKLSVQIAVAEKESAYKKATVTL